MISPHLLQQAFQRAAAGIRRQLDYVVVSPVDKPVERWPSRRLLDTGIATRRR
jgi:hypothetical protein